MNINCLLSLVLVVFCCALVNGYVQNEENMCTPGANNSILTVLDDIFMQQWDKPNPISLPVACEFKVYSSSYAYRIPKGTDIKITLLSYRNPLEANECLDFIQFVHGHSPASKRICDVTLVNGPTLVFDIRPQDLRVVIDVENGTEINEPLELLMVTTVQSQCYTNASCMKPCTDEKSCWQDTVDTSHLNLDMEICVTRKFFEEKFEEKSQLILNAYKAFEDRLLAVENFLNDWFDY